MSGRLFDPPASPPDRRAELHAELLELSMLLAGREGQAAWMPVVSRARRALRVFEEWVHGEGVHAGKIAEPAVKDDEAGGAALEAWRAVRDALAESQSEAAAWSQVAYELLYDVEVKSREFAARIEEL